MLTVLHSSRSNLLYAAMALLTSFSLSAQTDVKIGTNPGNKTASAVLELESTTKGFLLPRMTAVQMNAISAPANGLAVYNTDQQCTFIYRGTTWVSLCDSATNGLTKSGSVISLGGALTGATTLTTTATNTLTISGLQSGASTDSIMTLDAATGVLRRRTVADLVGGAITANNGLTINPSANVQLGGTLSQITSIAQSGNDLKISGGNIAIGSSTAPTSTLQLTGSMGVSYRKVTGATSLVATDYIVMANATSGAVALTLPTASTCTGRIYYIGKTDETTNNVTFSPALNLTESTTIASINFAKKYKVVSDGSGWWIYSE